MSSAAGLVARGRDGRPRTSLFRVERVRPRVDFDSREALLTLGTTASMLVGIVLVLFFEAALTVVGIVLIVVSAILFIADARDVVGKWGETREV